MILQRWYRELGGLAVFVLVLSAAVTWTNRSIEDDGSSDVNASQMTKARIYSDAAYRRSKFDDASPHLRDLLAVDPHNSHARFRLAECCYNRVIQSHARLQGLAGQPVTDSDDRKKLGAEMQQLGDEAIELYERSTQSHRYRGESLFKIAALSGFRKDREATLSALQRFLDLNYSTSNGIARTAEFDFLLEDSDFQRLILAELRIRRDKSGARPLGESRENTRRSRRGRF